MRRGPVSGRLAELPSEERPREKLFAKGAAALSDEELLALLLGTGARGRPVLETCRLLLSRGGLVGLAAQGERGLRAEHGIGDAKAARLAAALEIARRLSRSELAERDLVADPESAVRYLSTSLAGETREVMGALLLDVKNRLVRDALVFQGSLAHASVTPAPLFRIAIQAGAASLVLYHNHPSGDPTPSGEDRAVTRRFAEAGEQIGILVRDHLVIGRGRWFSFHREGLL